MSFSGSLSRSLVSLIITSLVLAPLGNIAFADTATLSPVEVFDQKVKTLRQDIARFKKGSYSAAEFSLLENRVHALTVSSFNTKELGQFSEPLFNLREELNNLKQQALKPKNVTRSTLSPEEEIAGLEGAIELKRKGLQEIPKTTKDPEMIKKIEAWNEQIREEIGKLEAKKTSLRAELAEQQQALRLTQQKVKKPSPPSEPLDPFKGLADLWQDAKNVFRRITGSPPSQKPAAPSAPKKPSLQDLKASVREYFDYIDKELPSDRARFQALKEFRKKTALDVEKAAKTGAPKKAEWGKRLLEEIDKKIAPLQEVIDQGGTLNPRKGRGLSVKAEPGRWGDEPTVIIKDPGATEKTLADKKAALKQSLEKKKVEIKARQENIASLMDNRKITPQMMSKDIKGIKDAATRLESTKVWRSIIEEQTWKDPNLKQQFLNKLAEIEEKARTPAQQVIPTSGEPIPLSATDKTIQESKGVMSKAKEAAAWRVVKNPAATLALRAANTVLGAAANVVGGMLDAQEFENSIERCLSLTGDLVAIFDNVTRTTKDIDKTSQNKDLGLSAFEAAALKDVGSRLQPLIPYLQELLRITRGICNDLESPKTFLERYGLIKLIADFFVASPWEQGMKEIEQRANTLRDSIRQVQQIVQELLKENEEYKALGIQPGIYPCIPGKTTEEDIESDIAEITTNINLLRGVVKRNPEDASAALQLEELRKERNSAFNCKERLSEPTPTPQEAAPSTPQKDITSQQPLEDKAQEDYCGPLREEWNKITNEEITQVDAESREVIEKLFNESWQEMGCAAL